MENRESVRIPPLVITVSPGTRPVTWDFPLHSLPTARKNQKGTGGMVKTVLALESDDLSSSPTSYSVTPEKVLKLSGPL